MTHRGDWYTLGKLLLPYLTTTTLQCHRCRAGFCQYLALNSHGCKHVSYTLNDLTQFEQGIMYNSPSLPRCLKCHRPALHVLLCCIHAQDITGNLDGVCYVPYFFKTQLILSVCYHEPQHLKQYFSNTRYYGVPIRYCFQMLNMGHCLYIYIEPQTQHVWCVGISFSPILNSLCLKMGIDYDIMTMPIVKPVLSAFAIDEHIKPTQYTSIKHNLDLVKQGQFSGFL